MKISHSQYLTKSNNYTIEVILRESPYPIAQGTPLKDKERQTQEDETSGQTDTQTLQGIRVDAKSQSHGALQALGHGSSLNKGLSTGPVAILQWVGNLPLHRDLISILCIPFAP